MTVQSKARFAVGQWMFFEFKLGQVKGMEDGRVTEFTDGSFNTSGNDLTDRCVPLTMATKRISDTYDYYSSRLHKEGSNGLNYPDIHRWMAEAWYAACSHAEDVAALKSDYDKVQKFCDEVLNKTDIDSGYGFPLLRRRAG